MIFALIGILIVMVLIFLAVIKYLPVPVPQAVVSSSYSQLDVFRDMEPNLQIRENQWVGFLQEDVNQKQNGNLGDFEGNDGTNVRFYAF